MAPSRSIFPFSSCWSRHLKPGALIVGENAFEEASGYIDYVRDPQNGYLSLSLPFDPGRGNELTIKTR